MTIYDIAELSIVVLLWLLALRFALFLWHMQQAMYQISRDTARILRLLDKDAAP